MTILYRGLNLESHILNEGKLIPKNNEPFISAPIWGVATWGNAYWGECPENAVIDHQKDQAGLPTSGISTTPHLERAIFYATHGGKFPKGYIYVIDRSILSKYGISAYIVNEIVPYPSVPEDEEVILVAEDNKIIPSEIIIEIREICSI